MQKKTGDKLLNCLNCFNPQHIFNYLNNDELKLINDNRTEVVYNKGELIHKSGTQSSHIVSFRSGLAKLYIEDQKGRNKIIKLIKDHDFFVSPGVFSDNRNHFSIKALTKSKVCLIESSAFKSIMEVNSKFAFEYINLVNESLLDITEKMYNMVRKHNIGKLAETILYLETDIYSTNPYTLTLSISDVADLSGVGRDSAIRILNELNHEGIIIYDKKSINIIDRKRLENLSENG